MNATADKRPQHRSDIDGRYDYDGKLDRMCVCGLQEGLQVPEVSAVAEDGGSAVMSDLIRKYRLSRVKAGDYIFLGNDGVSLWRVATYTEDGSAVTDAGRTISGLFWGTWLHIGKPRKGEAIDPSEWSDWQMRECLLKSRKAAIECALFDAQKMLEASNA